MLKFLIIPLEKETIWILASVSQIYLSITLKFCMLPIFLRNLSSTETIRNAAYLKSSICSPLQLLKWIFSLAEFSFQNVISKANCLVSYVMV